MSDLLTTSNLWRDQFPILKQTIDGKPLVYLDNAATTQKPQVVIDATQDYYQNNNANIHRGIHRLSEEATRHYEKTRQQVAEFLGTNCANEVVFTAGVTSAINLVAQSWGRANLTSGDQVIISEMEHHANIVPWQMICEQTGAELKVIPVTDSGEIDLTAYQSLLNKRVKMVAVNHVSNTLGTINPIKKMIAMAHEVGAKVLIDGAQAVGHIPVNVSDLNCDFYTFSGHKVYGPTGVGVLYGRFDYLQAMPPYQGGGDMIETVSFERTTYKSAPYKFEAGTPNIAGVVGLAAALDFISQQNQQDIISYEQQLLDYATESLMTVPGFEPLGCAKDKVAIISFNLTGCHPQDVAALLDAQGIAVRSGHHCTMPLMARFNLNGCVRVSVAFYNTNAEIDGLVNGLIKAQTVLTGEQ